MPFDYDEFDREACELESTVSDGIHCYPATTMQESARRFLAAIQKHVDGLAKLVEDGAANPDL